SINLALFYLDLKEQFTQLYRLNQQKPNLRPISPVNKTENQQNPNLRPISPVNKTENQQNPNLCLTSPGNKTEHQQNPNLWLTPPGTNEHIKQFENQAKNNGDNCSQSHSC